VLPLLVRLGFVATLPLAVVASALGDVMWWTAVCVSGAQ